MSHAAWKRLGTGLVIVSLVLAAVAVKVRHDLNRQIDEQAGNAALAAQGHPMGGRAATGYDDPRNKRRVYVTSAVAAFSLFSLALFCFALPRTSNRVRSRNES